ncbi:MAG TPA: radical SAM protein, partial [Bacteroidia bacterium]|nr:radical SAM protein [Bacteroidia bacterium]
MKSTVAFHTLGCKLNFAETSTIGRQLQDAGYKKVSFSDAADIYVINTCSVTENADRECRQHVNRALSSNPEGCVIIIGCYAQLKPDAIATIPGVSLVLGASEKFNIPHYLQKLKKKTEAQVFSCDIAEHHQFTSSYSEGDRTRVFLKVQDGCDYGCTFCTIPMARGASRSNTVGNVIENVKQIVNRGAKEIVLTGVNLGDFGKLPGEKKHTTEFFQLVSALDALDADIRFRIS